MSYSLWGNGEMGVLRGMTLPILSDYPNYRAIVRYWHRVLLPSWMKCATECHTMKEVFSFVSPYLLIGGRSATYAIVTESGLRNIWVLVCHPQLSNTQIVGVSCQQFITSVTVTLITFDLVQSNVYHTRWRIF